ncbi:hypothetical protein CN13_06605 [Petrotoga sp. HKA.pet.4.5]|uniref:hypothetical protein n=1 Tax=Petrotoga sp. HKA.pet.4.5 TaxID=1473155 RepID=UPI000EF167E5|nr:hypothetical protein [Petrotoga sp. HKA.pet.4.5]RLL89074.1 hypothetical protein CN13_06605 [Petrotoga sp. HKA.pet.4.5]
MTKIGASLFEEGVEKGERKGEREVIIEILNQRFGEAFDKRLEENIRKANEEIINQIAMANRILYHPANLIMYHIERRSSFLSLFI